MIAIVGNIKIDESKPERIKYLIACIRSYQFLKDECNFVLALDSPSHELHDLVWEELKKFPNKSLIDFYENNMSYGKQYMMLLEDECQECEFVINFMEDQFMVCDDIVKIQRVLETMKWHEAEICKASFFQVELNSIKLFRNLGQSNLTGSSFFNSEELHKEYQKYYGTRYYIGVNFITTLEFAKKFWNRNLGKRPHPYEIARYDEKWRHTVMFPNFPIMEAIDDDHGEPNTCLLKRTDCEKWNKIWKNI